MTQGPGRAVWLLVGISLLLPMLGMALGMTALGENPSLARLYGSVAFLLLALVVSVIIHSWGLVRGLYPAISKPWLWVAGWGLVSGVVTLAAAVAVFIVILRA